jgi:hypothetical protein
VCVRIFSYLGEGIEEADSKVLGAGFKSLGSPINCCRVDIDLGDIDLKKG